MIADIAPHPCGGGAKVSPRNCRPRAFFSAVRPIFGGSPAAAWRFSGVYPCVGWRTASRPLERGVRLGAKGHWLDVGAPRPHAPRQGAQALHRSWDLVCRAYTAILNVPKLRKICRLLWRQIFHSFVTGSARGGPHVPRTPLRWAAALRSTSWSGGLVRSNRSLA